MLTIGTGYDIIIIAPRKKGNLERRKGTLKIEQCNIKSQRNHKDSETGKYKIHTNVNELENFSNSRKILTRV